MLPTGRGQGPGWQRWAASERGERVAAANVPQAARALKDRVPPPLWHHLCHILLGEAVTGQVKRRGHKLSLLGRLQQWQGRPCAQWPWGQASPSPLNRILGSHTPRLMPLDMEARRKLVLHPARPLVFSSAELAIEPMHRHRAPFPSAGLVRVWLDPEVARLGSSQPSLPQPPGVQAFHSLALGAPRESTSAAMSSAVAFLSHVGHQVPH